MPRDGMLKLTALLLRALFWLNIVTAIGFAAALIVSVPLHGACVDLLARKYAGRLDIDLLIEAMRLMMVLGLGAVAAAWVIITRLEAMIATVAAGDPFAAGNAARLQTIGWGLLGWQLLDLALGGMVGWISRIGADTGGWMPSLSGWVVTLLVFVLARVFAVGAAMRSDLESTI